MRRLTWIIVTAGLLWSFLWLTASLMIRNGIIDWAATKRAEGWVAQIINVDVDGYPFRFETHLSPVSLQDDTSGVRVFSPALSLATPAWWPGYATLTLPQDRIDITAGAYAVKLMAEDAQAGLRIHPGTALELESLRLDSAQWDLQTAKGRLFTGNTLQAFFDQSTTQPSLYDFQFSIDDLAFGDVPRALLGIPQDWPHYFDTAAATGAVGFSAPLDRSSVRGGMPPPNRIEIVDAKAIWGSVEISAQGVLDVDPDGTPKGDVSLFVDNWRILFDVAKASDLAIPAQADLMLNALANIGGDPDTLELTLSFADGLMSLSGIALGPAPRLRARQ